MRTFPEQAVGRALRITRLTKALGGILLLALFHNPARATQSVTLAWDSSPDTSTVGYNLYYGATPHTHANLINAGNTPSATIGSLIEGVTYFFAVTAYDSLGLESDYSSEVSYLVPTALPILKVRPGLALQFVLTVAGPVGHVYIIQTTQDFKTWTAIGTVTVPSGGSSEFVDANASNSSKGFYRTQ